MIHLLASQVDRQLVAVITGQPEMYMAVACLTECGFERCGTGL
jgi:hypothetical protein